LTRSTVAFVELGMLAGIVVAGYVLPGRTPLLPFLIASGACFVTGNIFLAKKIKQAKSGESSAKQGPWLHIFRAIAILAGFWLLILLVFKR